MKRPDPNSAADRSIGAKWADEDDVAQVNELYHFMADTKWDDGLARETGTVMLTVDAGVLKAWVHDRAMKRSAWVSGTSLRGILDAVSLGLLRDSLEWRPDKGGRK